MLSGKHGLDGDLMKVKIKAFNVDMDVKNNGVEFQVHSNDGEFLGDCYVTKSGMIWCRGKTTRANGVKVGWEEFINWMEEE